MILRAEIVRLEQVVEFTVLAAVEGDRHLSAKNRLGAVACLLLGVRQRTEESVKTL